jgi:hypothetical protein
MSKSNGLETSLLALLFNATAIANIADNAASAPATNIYVSLHTNDPGEGGSQTTNEVSYTSYARVAVARTSGGWTVASGQVTNAASVTFPKATGVADNATAIYFGIGLSSSGAGTLEYSGPLASNLGIGTGKASTDTITIPGLSGLSVGDKLLFITIPGGTIPAGITEGTTYFAKTVSGNDITISTTSGGSTLDITADGACLVVKLSPLAISQNIQPVFSASSLVISED